MQKLDTCGVGHQAIKREMDLMDSKFDKEKAQQRIAALGGGIARIKVSASPEAIVTSSSRFGGMKPCASKTAPVLWNVLAYEQFGLTLLRPCVIPPRSVPPLRPS